MGIQLTAPGIEELRKLDALYQSFIAEMHARGRGLDVGRGLHPSWFKAPVELRARGCDVVAVWQHHRAYEASRSVFDEVARAQGIGRIYHEISVTRSESVSYFSTQRGAA